MKKTIESVWKDAFMSNKNMVVPDVKDLYDKKSIHIIDKFMAMFKINLIAILVGAFVILFVFSYIGIPIVAVTFFVLSMVLVITGKQELDKLEKLLIPHRQVAMHRQPHAIAPVEHGLR